MKKVVGLVLGVALSGTVLADKKAGKVAPQPAMMKAQDMRQVTFEVKTVDGATHWEPGSVDVKPGETVKFIIKNDLATGPDFHGFAVEGLKIQKQINRGKTEEIVAQIPADMKEGDYPVSCRFHPKHVPAKLVVKKSH